MFTVKYVSSLGHRGPKATRVNFGPLHQDSVRLWAWIPNETADKLAEGLQVTGDFSVRPNGEVQSSYEKDGQTIALRQPVQQVWLNGKFVFTAPEQGSATFVVDDQALAYVENVRNKKVDSTPITELVADLENF